MFDTVKTRLTVTAAVIVMGGVALTGISRPTFAQTSTPVPATATAQCALQDTTNTVDPAATPEPAVTPEATGSAETTDQQCGDQSNADSTVDSAEPTANAPEIDQVGSQDGSQTQADNQPETADTSAQ